MLNALEETTLDNVLVNDKSKDQIAAYCLWLFQT